MLRRKISTKEVYKVQFVSECWPNKIGPDAGERWDEMVKTIIGMRKQLECFYNFQIPEDNYSENFAVLMLVDSLFLLCFFLFSTDSGDDLRVRIKCDILKLENQIPLSVLCKILTTQFPNWEARIEELLRNTYKELSPFDLSRDQSIDIGAFHSKPHLLGCIHALVLPFLQIQKPLGDSASGGSTLLQKISSFLDCVVEKMCGIFFCFKHQTEGKLPIKSYTARQLARAGIKFKSFSTLPANIRFDKNSHTLYLPRMTVSSLQTEAFFKNLVALELNDWAGAKSASNGHHVDSNNGATSAFNRHHVRRFIQLTNCLIDTFDDVHVLRKSKVISPKTTLADGDIATIWNSMRQLLFHSQIQPPEELKEAIDEVLKANYYKTKIRIGLSEFFHYYYEKYFLHPWTFIALLAAIFLLFLTVIQTYCSVWGCSSMKISKEGL